MDNLVKIFLEDIPEKEVDYYNYAQENLGYKIHKTNGFLKWYEEYKKTKMNN